MMVKNGINHTASVVLYVTNQRSVLPPASSESTLKESQAEMDAELPMA